jgi:hypothetical protein
VRGTGVRVEGELFVSGRMLETDSE